jgi:hypothetical protein
MKEVKIFGLMLVSIIFCIALASAGLGIKYSQQSALVNEGGEACLTYSVYNPWEEDTYATVGLSSNLLEILTVQEAEAKNLPAHTSSDNAIPIEFCFKVPQVYSKDCSVGPFICEQTCTEDKVEYVGEVVVSSLPNPTQMGGAGSSSTQYSVSAPLTIRIACTAHARDYLLLYVAIALISAIVIATVLIRKYRKPKAERDKEKLRKLRVEIAKESKSKRKKK